MSDKQIIYSVIIAFLWLVKADRFVMGWLTFNLLATLFVAGLMDFGFLGRIDSTRFMMIIDLATGASLVRRAGLARLISLGYAISIPLYSINLFFGVQPEVTFTIIFLVAFIQLGIVCVGTFGGGDSGRKFRNRRNPISGSLGTPKGYAAGLGVYPETHRKIVLNDIDDFQDRRLGSLNE